MAPRKQQKKSTNVVASASANLYAELGLARDASIDDIKRAYRRLALQCHPDKCPGDDAANERFQRISMAYSVLSDEQKRRYYDQTGTTEGLDISPDEFLDMFQSLLLEIIGGADMIRAMLSCFTPRELARLPPFPFPKELFPPGTFPPGLRFSSKGLKGLPPQIDELIQSGDLHAMFAAMSGCSPSGTDGHGRSGKSRSGGATSGRGHHAAPRDPYGFGRRGGAMPPCASFPFINQMEQRDSSGGSFDSSDSEWTDVSESELEAVLAQQRIPPPCPEHWKEAPTLTSAAAATAPNMDASSATSGVAAGADSSPSLQQSPCSPSSPPLPHKHHDHKNLIGQQCQTSPLQQQLIRDWMMAARSCDVGALARLLEQDPRLLCSRGTGMGHTALHWCAAKGSVEGVNWLLHQGTDINVRNDDGATPLHAAARNGRLEVVHALLAWRENSNRNPAPPATAASCAPPITSDSVITATVSGISSEKVVCDLAAVDGEGRTALQLALAFQHVEVVALLRRAAAAAAAAAAGGEAERLRSQPSTSASTSTAPRSGELHAGRAGGSTSPLRMGGAGAVSATAPPPPGMEGLQTSVPSTSPEGMPTVAATEPRSAMIGAVSEPVEPAAAADGADSCGPGLHAALLGDSGSGSIGYHGSAASGSGTAEGSGSSGWRHSAAMEDPAAEQDGAGGGCMGLVRQHQGDRVCMEMPGRDSDSERRRSSDAVSAPSASRACGIQGGAGKAPVHKESDGTDCALEAGRKPQGARCSYQHDASSVPAAASAAAGDDYDGAGGGCGASGGKALASVSDGGPVAAVAASAPPPPRRSALTPEEKAARRAALLAADAAAEREESRKEAEKAALAKVAAIAAGLRSREEGKAWLEAARRGDLAVLQRMLAENPRLLGYQGQGTNFAFTSHTALHWAAAKGHTAVARWLLQKGADPDLLNAAGATPLHAAARHRSDDCARLLVLEASAKMGVPDSLGETARDIFLQQDAASYGSGGSGGGSATSASAARLVLELELLGRVAALRDAPGGTAEWTARAMRGLLAAAGINPAGLLERRELVDASSELISRYPPRISVIDPVVGMKVEGFSEEAAATAVAGAADTRHPGVAVEAAVMAESSSCPAESGGSEQWKEPSVGPARCPAKSAEMPPTSDFVNHAKENDDGVATADSATAAAAAVSAASDAAKQRGNEAFSRGEFSKAVSHYTMAIRLRTEPNAVLYSNRAAAYCGMRYFGKAQADAEAAIRLEPQQPKYHCRLGVALLGQLQCREADAAFRAALKLNPTYAAALQGLQDVRAASNRTEH